MSKPSNGRSRITVVNDSADFLELMRDVLGDAGYEVTTFEGERSSIEEIAASQPNLLVIDLRLGGSAPSGWDIAMLARADEGLRDVPIVICSADTQLLRERESEMTAVADVHLLDKPFALGHAEDLIGHLLARS